MDHGSSWQVSLALESAWLWRSQWVNRKKRRVPFTHICSCTGVRDSALNLSLERSFFFLPGNTYRTKVPVTDLLWESLWNFKPENLLAQILKVSTDFFPPFFKNWTFKSLRLNYSYYKWILRSKRRHKSKAKWFCVMKVH